MSELPTIRTPWKQQWRRIRYQWIPIVTMAISTALAATLWHRHFGAADSIGHVQEVKAAAIVRENGTLVSLGDKELSLYSSVQEGQTIARLDDRQVTAQLITLRAEVAKLRSELNAKNIAFARTGSSASDPKSPRPVAIDLEDARLEHIDRQAILLQDQLALNNAELALSKAQQAANAATFDANNKLPENITADRQKAASQKQVIVQRMATNKQAADAAQAKLAAIEEKLNLPENVVTAEVEALVAPFRSLAGIHDAKVRKIALEIDTLDIKSPLTGQIIKIDRRPGQVVQAGDPIMMIANQQSNYIITYVRADQRITPKPDMEVMVHPRLSPGRGIAATIASVGPQMEEIPDAIGRSQKVKEWGFPVMIKIPAADGLKLRPGDLVDVRFPRS